VEVIRDLHHQYSGTYGHDKGGGGGYSTQACRPGSIGAMHQVGICRHLWTANGSPSSFKIWLSHRHQPNSQMASSPAILDFRFRVLVVRNPDCQITGQWLCYWQPLPICSTSDHYSKTRCFGLQMCIDYRRLNEITTGGHYSPPYIEDFINWLYCSTVFTKLNLASCYHQLGKHPEDRYNKAVVTRDVFYRWMVMPFGWAHPLSAIIGTMGHTVRPDKNIAIL